MAAGSLTGRAGSMTLAGATIPITKWTAKITKALVDATDSDPTYFSGGQLYASNLPGTLGCDGTIEGYWDANSTNTNLFSFFANDSPRALVLKYNTTTTAISGNFDLSDIEISLEVPGASMTKFTANFKSHGVFTID